MPKKTPQAVEQRCIEMRQSINPKTGKQWTYSEIRKETGVDDPVQARIYRRAGLTRPSRALPAKEMPLEPATMAEPTAPLAPSKGASLEEFQPPPLPKAKAPKEVAVAKEPEVYSCVCGADFTLDEGENIDSVTCPGCGEGFE